MLKEKWFQKENYQPILLIIMELKNDQERENQQFKMKEKELLFAVTLIVLRVT